MNTVQSQILQLARRVDNFSKAGGKLGVVTITTSAGATTVTITAANHGFQTGDIVLIAGVATKTDLNGNTYTITVTSINAFTVTQANAQGDGTGGTATTVCVTDGERFTKDRLLSIYNEARLALFTALKTKYGPANVSKFIDGALVSTAINSTTGSTSNVNQQEYTIPTGYAQFVGMYGFSGTAAVPKWNPIILLPQYMWSEVLRANDPTLAQSVTNRFIFQIGSKLIHPEFYTAYRTGTGTNCTAAGGVITGVATLFTTEAVVGGKIMLNTTEFTITGITSDTVMAVTPPTGVATTTTFYYASYILEYIGITNFTLANVTGGSVVESFNVDFEPKIIDLAEKIVLEQGGADLAKIAEAMV